MDKTGAAPAAARSTVRIWRLPIVGTIGILIPKTQHQGSLGVVARVGCLRKIIGLGFPDDDDVFAVGEDGVEIVAAFTADKTAVVQDGKIAGEDGQEAVARIRIFSTLVSLSESIEVEPGFSAMVFSDSRIQETADGVGRGGK